MLSRVRYIFRETFDSFRRNATLTVAAIITAAISLSASTRPHPSSCATAGWSTRS